MKNRILSIDVLRGLTICLMIVVNTPGSWNYVYAPLKHSAWNGCTPTDLVFPSFLFVVGLSMSISMRKLNRDNKLMILCKLVKRAGLIFLVGLLLNWFPFFQTGLSELRIFGVLQRISLAFLIGGLCIVLFQYNKPLILSTGFLLVSHWMLLYFFDGDSPYALESNIGRTIDIFLVGKNHIYQGFGIPFDPEGLLGTLSSSAQVILGYLIGKHTLKNGIPGGKELNKLGIISLGFIVISLVWNNIYPINKPLWTGSYVLYTSGIITGVWAILIWGIDIKQKEKWTLPFKVFGQNPLASYVLSILVVKLFIYVFKIGETSFYGWTYTEIFQKIFDNYLGSFMYAICFTFFIWLFAYWLYRKGKVIKI